MGLDCTKITSSSSTWLQKGSKGAQVTELQKALQQRGYYKGYKVDGDFGNLTKQAVMSFQKATNNTQDGKVGPATCKSLNNVVETVKVEGFDCPNVYLAKDRTNDASLVKKLQTGLQTLGYYKGYKVDGVYGTYTANAVAAFQRNTGHSPDGEFGPKTCPDFNAKLGWSAGKTKKETKTTVTKKKATEIVIDAKAANFLTASQANLIIDGVYLISSSVEDTRSVEGGDWQTVELMGDKTYTYMGHSQPREYDITVYLRKDDWFQARTALIQMTKKVCDVSGFGITAGKYVISWVFSVENPNWYKLVFHLLQFRG